MTAGYRTLRISQLVYTVDNWTTLGDRQLEGVREFARQVGPQIGVLEVPEVRLLG